MRYAKCLVAAMVAGLTTLGTAMTDDKVTSAEWVGVAVATLVALGAVWAVPNASQTGGYRAVDPLRREE